MAVKVYAATLIGLDGQTVEVEVDITRGLFKFEIVGLAGKAVQEAKERVAAAIKNCGAFFPRTHITVNLAPADIPKSGPLYDLPIAIGILVESGQLDIDLKGKIFIGELSLEGQLRAVPGVLPITEYVKKEGFKQIFLPDLNIEEAKIIKGIKVVGVTNLKELFNIKKLTIQAKRRKVTHSSYIISRESIMDISQVKGQPFAKRALAIAAAGGHNILFSGSPGSGKSMLAKRIPGILPDMTLDERLEVTKIYSAVNLLPKDQSLIRSRPFRSPHHTISQIALVGGGSFPKPGEISLAHRGVLFLDEFTEFTSQAMEVLRQPLEDNKVTIARASGSVTYPANFMLVASMNPCRCGYLGDSERECSCSAKELENYAKRLSGPIWDRIDLQIKVQRVLIKSLSERTKEDGSAKVRKSVQKARLFQLERFKGSAVKCNADMQDNDIYKLAQLKRSAKTLVDHAAQKLGLSARSYFRVLKVARTIADLDGEESITKENIAEALGYRLITKQ